MYETIIYNSFNNETFRATFAEKETALRKARYFSLFKPEGWYVIVRDEEFNLIAWFEQGTKNNPF